MINTISDLNKFANGCDNCDQILKKLIDKKQLISAKLAKLLTSPDKNNIRILN